MSMPTLPSITPAITLERAQVLNLLLASVAFEELGQAHIVNAEAEKIQYVLGTLPGTMPPAAPTTNQLLQVNTSVDGVIRTIVHNQMLLSYKLRSIMNNLSTLTTEASSETAKAGTTNSD